MDSLLVFAVGVFVGMWARSPRGTCSDCGKSVRTAKPLLGSLHLCVSAEERAVLDRGRKAQQVPPPARPWAPR
jgi:hypothetical protein